MALLFMMMNKPLKMVWILPRDYIHYFDHIALAINGDFNMLGKTIKLFLTEGEPNGLTIAEVLQWTGVSLSCPRLEIDKLLKRQEVKKPGVYILIGPGKDMQTKIAYIGEAESVDSRIREHHRKLEFWDRICFFTQKDDNLTKGHVRYLEARMIQIANDAKRMPLENKCDPEPENIPLPESDIADMEYFILHMQMVLPVLGISLLQPQPTISEREAQESTEESPLFVLKSADASATAKFINNEFVVIAGSLARIRTTESIHGYMKKIRQEMMENGVIEKTNGKQYRFVQNYAFSSPSTASGVILGRSSNGRTAWKVKETGQSYGEWDEKRLLN